MEGFLPVLLRMSLTGALTVLAVLLGRLCLRRAPRKYVCLLWLAVLFRLLCPVTLRAPTSVVPEKLESGALVSAWTESYAEETKVIQRGEQGYKAALDAGRTPVYDYLPAEVSGKEEAAPDPVEREDTPSASDEPERRHSYVVTASDGLSEPKRAGELWLPVLSWVWLAGAAALLLWSVFKYLRLRFRLREAVKLEKGVYEAEGLDSPFVLGVLRPRVYLPWGMETEERGWVLRHERAHIRRLDPLWKLLGWVALCLHWFNPLCWLAFSLAMQDMEGACDEAVVGALGGEERAAYSRLLLALSGGRPLFAATPLGFGEGNVKQRIKSVLRWRKPKWWMALLAILLLAAVVLLFAFGPGNGRKDFPDIVKDPPDTWPQMSFYKQEWTDVAAGQRGVWPVEDVKGFKKELAKLLKEGEWRFAGTDSVITETINGKTKLVIDWREFFRGKIRWVSGGKTWSLYVGDTRIALVSGDFEQDHSGWIGYALAEDGTRPDRQRMEAILALTEWGQPELTLEPEADLCFAGLPWGCTLEDAQAALPGAARDGLTLTVTDAAVSGFRADVILSFEEDEGGTFLNTAALTFTEEPEKLTLKRFDRAVLCEDLSKVWGERHNMLPQPRDSTEALIDDWGNPERLWYWYTEDFSDELEWLGGVVAWFERTGDPRTLYIDASGRNLAAGRQFDVERNALTVQEILNLHDLLERRLPDGCEFSNGSEGRVILRVAELSDLEWLKELLRCWPWVEVGRRVVIDGLKDTAPEPSPLPHYPVEEGWTELTEEEIEEAREALEPIRYGEDGSMWVNPVDPCFTSLYTDPRDLDLNAFLRYFDYGEEISEEEFRALRDAGYLSSASRWQHTEDYEAPLRRIPARMVEDALRLYFDIGLADLTTDYRTKFRYTPETDCFYSMTSDFGPGTFQPQWGERKDDLVRLWSGGTCLTCRKLEDRWIIVSYWNENVGERESAQDDWWPAWNRDWYRQAEYRWVFTTAETAYVYENLNGRSEGTFPAGHRLNLLRERITREGELWLQVDMAAEKSGVYEEYWVRGADVIPWTEELAAQTVWPVYIPAGITYYPKSFGNGDGESKTLAECLDDENAYTHGYDMTGVIRALEDGYALVGFAGGMEIWVKHEELTVGRPESDEPSEYTRMLTAGRIKAIELGYPLETWGAELIWHRGKSEDGSSAYYAAYYPVSTGEGTVCVVFTGSYETGYTPAEALFIPPDAEDWP